MGNSRTISGYLTILMLISMVIVLARCATEVAGGFGSETTNGMTVSGIVYSENGAAIDSAVVFIRHKSFLADTLSTGDKPEPDAVTDAGGYFEIDSVDTGEYYLEVNYKLKQARLIACHKESDLEPLDSLNIDLKQVAGFYGTVDRENIDVSADVYVQIYGLDRIQKADTSGEFYFSGIPEGTHIIRVISSDASHGTIDQDTVEVNAAENRDVGTYLMPFEAWRDTVVVRRILDTNGLVNTPVSAVVSIGKMGRVYDLNLSNRSITVLPPVIGKLRLRKLRIKENPLDSLPDEIGRILSLYHLVLQKNQLVYIPESFGDLTHLKHLDISGNKLAELPASIINLTNLDFLTLIHNRLKSVPTPVKVWIDNNSYESNWEDLQDGKKDE